MSTAKRQPKQRVAIEEEVVVEATEEVEAIVFETDAVAEPTEEVVVEATEEVE